MLKIKPEQAKLGVFKRKGILLKIPSLRMKKKLKTQ